MGLKEAWRALNAPNPQETVPRDLKGEIGYTGSKIFSGLPMDEYNPTLAFPQSVEIYDQMRRSDGQVAAILNAIKLPIRAADWHMAPAEDAKDKRLAEEIADFVTHNFLDGGMRFSWDDHVREALLMLDFGFSVFEKVYRMDTWRRRPVIMLDKYAPRVAPSIWRFPQNEKTGAIEAIQQLNVYTGELYDIPLNKVRLYTFQREGDDPVGISVLRPMYKPWYIKQALERITAVGVEKTLIGTAYATLPKGVSDKDRQNVLDALSAIRTSESNAITVPEGVVLAVLEGKSNAMNAVQYIEYHDVQMARSALAQFISLGTTLNASGGSYSLGQNMVGMFCQSLEAVAKYIAGEVQQDIAQLVEWNWGPDAPVPRLEHGTITVDSLSDRLQAIAALGNGHLLNPDESLEDYLRRQMGVPPIPEAALANQRSMPVTNYVPPIVPDTRLTPAQVAQIQQQQASIGTTQKGMLGAPAHGGPAQGAQPSPSAQKMSFEGDGIVWVDGVGAVQLAENHGQKPEVVSGAWPRDLTRFESAQHLRALDRAWKSHEAQWTHTLTQHQRAVVRELAAIATATLVAGSVAASLAAIHALTVPVGLQLQYQQAIQEQLTAAAQTGQTSVASELALLAPGVLDAAVTASIAQKAALLTAGQLERLLHAFQWGAVQQAERGATPDAIVRAGRASASQRIESQEIPVSGMVSIGEVLNQARDSTGEQLGVQGAQWCAVLDNRTCPLCAELDGKVMKVGTPAFDRFRPPAHYNCRCIRVFIGPTEPDVHFDWVNPSAALIKQYASFWRA